MATKTGPTDPPVGGGLADIGAIAVGDTATCTAWISAEMIDHFAALSGDHNPLHLDHDVATRLGFERPVAHGLLALAMISRLIGTELPGRGSLWVSHHSRFTSPTLAGDHLIARVTVEQVSVAAGLVMLRTQVTNQRTGQDVVAGTAKVKVLPVASPPDSPQQIQ